MTDPEFTYIIEIGYTPTDLAWSFESLKQELEDSIKQMGVFWMADNILIYTDDHAENIKITLRENNPNV